MTGIVTIDHATGQFELWQTVAGLPGSIPAPHESASKTELEDLLDFLDNAESQR